MIDFDYLGSIITQNGDGIKEISRTLNNCIEKRIKFNNLQSNILKNKIFVILLLSFTVT